MQTSRFEANVRPGGAGTVVELVGDVDAGAESALDTAWVGAAERGGVVTLDFARVGYVNSTGIALLVGLLARARRDRVDVEARGLSDHYREIFEITRIADFVRILPDGSAQS
jgi:anti-anti-sigma factor